jgi:two-component sensor histidine kinase
MNGFYFEGKKISYLLDIAQREHYKNPELALKVANEAYFRAKVRADKKLIAHAALWLSWLDFQYNTNENLSNTLYLASLSTDLFRQIDEPAGLSWSLCLKAGVTLDINQDTISPTNYLKEAALLIPKIKNHTRDSNWILAYWNLVSANINPKEQHKLLLKSLQLYRQTGDSTRIGRIYLNLCNTMLDQQKYDDAIAYANLSVNAFMKDEFKIYQQEAFLAYFNVHLLRYVNFPTDENFEKIIQFHQSPPVKGNRDYAYLMRLGMAYNQRLYHYSKERKKQLKITENQKYPYNKREIALADTAFQYFKNSLEFAKTNGKPKDIDWIYANMEFTCEYLNNCDTIKADAINTYKEALVKSQTSIVDAQKKLTEGYNEAQERTIQEERTNLKYAIFIGLAILGFTVMAFYNMYQRRNIINMNRELNSRMEALRAQMNPHFISNALNAIDSLVNQNRNKEASYYIIQFSRLCRIILNNSRSESIALGEELDMLKYFMNLEQLRMDDRLQYQFDLDKALNKDQIAVPPMILQPFVENAIWHGIVPKTGAGLVSIKTIKKDDNLYQCIVEDNGVGRVRSAQFKAESVMSRPSFGLVITEERIEKLYQLKGSQIVTEDLYHPDGSAAGTRVTITLPIQNISA